MHLAQVSSSAACCRVRRRPTRIAVDSLRAVRTVDVMADSNPPSLIPVSSVSKHSARNGTAQHNGQRQGLAAHRTTETAPASHQHVVPSQHAPPGPFLVSGGEDTRRDKEDEGAYNICCSMFTISFHAMNDDGFVFHTMAITVMSFMHS